MRVDTKSTSNDLRLVAYVVADLDQPLSIDLLRSFLSAQLPDYMVPNHFVDLGQITAYSQWKGRL